MQHHPINRRRFLSSAVLLPFCAHSPAWASTSTLNLRGLQFVVPTPTGAQPDVIARWIAEPLGRKAGAPAVVVNMPGAAGALAADAVLRSHPENGPLLLGGLDHVAYSHMNSTRRPLDPFVDFTPVAAVNRDSWVVATSGENPERSLSALVDRSMREPLNYASTGEGSTAHLITARLSIALRMPAQHIAYSTPWMSDLITGRIQFVVAPIPAVLPQLRSGRLQALATLTDKRISLPGNPPSMPELGLPDQVFYGGLFLFAPAALVSLAPQLNAWVREVVGSQEMLDRYREAFIESVPLDWEGTGDLVRQRLQLVDSMRLAVFGKTR